MKSIGTSIRLRSLAPWLAAWALFACAQAEVEHPPVGPTDAGKDAVADVHKDSPGGSGGTAGHSGTGGKAGTGGSGAMGGSGGHAGSGGGASGSGGGLAGTGGGVNVCGDCKSPFCAFMCSMDCVAGQQVCGPDPADPMGCLCYDLDAGSDGDVDAPEDVTEEPSYDAEDAPEDTGEEPSYDAEDAPETSGDAGAEVDADDGSA